MIEKMVGPPYICLDCKTEVGDFRSVNNPSCKFCYHLAYHCGLDRNCKFCRPSVKEFNKIWDKFKFKKCIANKTMYVKVFTYGFSCVCTDCPIHNNGDYLFRDLRKLSDVYVYVFNRGEVTICGDCYNDHFNHAVRSCK